MLVKVKPNSVRRRTRELAAGWNVSAEFLSLANRIHALYPKVNPRGTLIIPGCPATLYNRTTGELARCLRQLSGEPVLVIDLTRGSNNQRRKKISLDFTRPENLADGTDDWRAKLVSEVPVVRARPKAPYHEWPDVLRSESFGRSLQALHELYGHVLIRGEYPPESVATMLAAQQVDGAVLVVGAGVTALTDAKRAQQTIESAASNLWGFIFDRKPVVRSRK